MKTNSKEFKALKKEWYDKLKENGFEDIEHLDNSLARYESYHHAERYNDDIKRDAKIYYYDKAEKFYQNYKFSSEKDKTIWKFHKEGISVRNIVKQLDAVGIKSSRDTVSRIVLKLRKEMLSINEY